MVAEVFRHLETFIQISYLRLGGRSIWMALGQVLQDLLAAMELANVPFCIVFIDSWVDDFACSVFYLNLQGLVSNKCLKGGQ